jgi:hypothetical protein
MPIYSITSKTSGADLGTFHAADERHALDAMVRDAGCDDFADACERSGDDGSHLRVIELRHIEIVVPADEDEDDPEQAAEQAYLADRPTLKGWDLSPQLDDERDTVTLTIPAWAAPVDLEQLTARVTGRGESSTVPDNACAVDADIELNGMSLGSVTLLPDERSNLTTWGGPENWGDDSLWRWIGERVEAAGQERSEVIAAVVAAVCEAAKGGPTP